MRYPLLVLLCLGLIQFHSIVYFENSATAQTPASKGTTGTTGEGESDPGNDDTDSSPSGGDSSPSGNDSSPSGGDSSPSGNDSSPSGSGANGDNGQSSGRSATGEKGPVGSHGIPRRPSGAPISGLAEPSVEPKSPIDRSKNRTKSIYTPQGNVNSAPPEPADRTFFGDIVDWIKSKLEPYF